MITTSKITGRKIELTRNGKGILVCRYAEKPSVRLAAAIQRVIDSGTLSK